MRSFPTHLEAMKGLPGFVASCAWQGRGLPLGLHLQPITTKLAVAIRVNVEGDR